MLRPQDGYQFSASPTPLFGNIQLLIPLPSPQRVISLLHTLLHSSEIITSSPHRRLSVWYIPNSSIQELKSQQKQPSAVQSKHTGTPILFLPTAAVRNVLGQDRKTHTVEDACIAALHVRKGAMLHAIYMRAWQNSHIGECKLSQKLCAKIMCLKNTFCCLIS